MRGDIYDVKQAFLAALTTDRLSDAMTTALADKPDDSVPDLSHVSIVPYQRLTKLQFPVCELISYSTVYQQDTEAKVGRHKVGFQWSALEPTEERATRSVELLCRATVDIFWDEATGLLSGLLSDAGLNAGPVTVVEEDYCVAPEARILRSDLVWVRADELAIGEELIAFVDGKRHKSKFAPSVVTGVRQISRPRVRVETSRGSIVVAARHPFKARRLHGGLRGWIEAKDLRPGSSICHFGEPWEFDASRDGGYLAGLFDGEGWASHNGLGIAQNRGGVLDRIDALLESGGYVFRKKGRTKLQTRVARGLRESLRLLGRIRPPRLLTKARPMWEGKTTFGKGMITDARVQSVVPIGDGPVMAISTTTGTYIAEGFFSHNSPLVPHPGNLFLRSGLVIVELTTFRGNTPGF